MFPTKTFSIGDTKVGTRHSIEFKYERIKTISQIKACGCMSIANYVNENRIVIEYIAEPLPKHLELDGHINYPLNKVITVTCDTFDGEVEVKEQLFITGTVYNN